MIGTQRPRRRHPLALAILAAAAAMRASPGQAASPMPPWVSTARPDLPAGIPLLPGHQGAHSEIWGTMEGWPVVRNVTAPTLTPVLPDAGHGNGLAVIVAPGGGFMSLSIGSEGFAVAKWLAAHGTAAFVLKYRLKPTPIAPDRYAAAIEAKFAPIMQGKPIPPADLQVPDQAMADAVAALRLVRAQAAHWQIDPARVGLMGFSAGAMTAIQTALSAPADARPDFIAPIYPPLMPVAATPAVPPMFVAIAADDPLFGRQGFGLIQSWLTVHRPVEFHFYEQGSHGFGLRETHTTSQDFIVAFQHWTDLHGWTGQPLRMPQ